MILKQLKRIGDVAFNIEDTSEFQRIVNANVKIPEDIEKVVIMNLRVEALLEPESRKNLDKIISFNLSEYTSGDIYNYVLDTPYGRNQNYSPILLWTDDGNTPNEKLEKKRRKLVNMYKKQKKKLIKWKKNEILEQEDQWFLDYLSWFSDEENQNEFLKYLSTYMDKKKKKLNKGVWNDLIIIPKFSDFNNGNAKGLYPGEIEIIRKLYISLKKPKSKKKKKCMVCGENKEIPTKATQANKTKWYTIDQLSFIKYFFEDEFTAAPICYDCLDSIEKGLAVCKDIGNQFKLGFALKEGGNMKKIYQIIIPLSIDKDHLKSLIKRFQGLSETELIQEEMKTLNVFEQEDAAESDNGQSDLILLSIDKEFVKTSYLFIHYVKEESGGMHRLISQSMTKRDYLETIKGVIEGLKKYFPKRRFTIKSLFYLFNFDPKESNHYLGKSPDGKSSSLATYSDEVFYYLNALLTGDRVFRDEFISKAFKTIKQANEIYCKTQIKYQQQENNKILKKAKSNARLKTESFMMFYQLFNELNLFINK